MAATPLFLADVDALKKELGLSKVDATRDERAQTAILRSVADVVNGFIRRLGIARVNALVAITPPAGNPTDNDEFLRSLAASTEVAWNRANLYRTLPTIFRDSDGSARLDWQTDGLTRETSEEQREKEIDRLMRDVDQNMDLLSAVEEAAAETTIETHVPTPTNPPRPLESAFPDQLWPGYDS